MPLWRNSVAPWRTSAPLWSCDTLSVVSVDSALLVERHVAEWLRAQAIVPGVELHDDLDITWVVHPGRAWSDVGIIIRFAQDAAASRLDALVNRYRAHRRGMGLWVSPAATPETLPELLKARALRCRKRFPAMWRDLSKPIPRPTAPTGVTIRPVTDVDLFRTTLHPSIGPLTTPLRRAGFRSFRALVGNEPDRCRAFVAWSGATAVGATLVSRKRVRGPSRRRRDRNGARPRHRRRARRIIRACIGQERRVEHRVAGDGHGRERVRALRLRRGRRFGYWYRSFRR